MGEAVKALGAVFIGFISLFVMAGINFYFKNNEMLDVNKVTTGQYIEVNGYEYVCQPTQHTVDIKKKEKELEELLKKESK